MLNNIIHEDLFSKYTYDFLYECFLESVDAKYEYCIMHYRPCNAPWADPISLIPMTSIKKRKEKSALTFSVLAVPNVHLLLRNHRRGSTQTAPKTAITRWKLCMCVHFAKR